MTGNPQVDGVELVGREEASAVMAQLIGPGEIVNVKLFTRSVVDDLYSRGYELVRRT